MSASDESIKFSDNSMSQQMRRKVWEAKIPVVIEISNNDLEMFLESGALSSSQISRIKSRPFAVFAARTSYFPLLLPQLRRHYDEVFTVAYKTPNLYSPWFEHHHQGGRPLSWHFPIGHLFDECRSWSESSQPPNLDIAWFITLHFSHYPSELLPLPDLHVKDGGGVTGLHFYSMLKQSDYIRHGSNKGIMSLTKSEQTQLWNGLWTHSHDRFWSVYSKVLSAPSSQGIPSMWKSIPLRIYMDGKPLRKIIQCPVKINDSTQTLGEAIMPILEASFNVVNCEIISHGVNLPLDSSLAWLALNFVYPDGFLHMVFKEMR